jgi:hypothetical protein
LQPIPVAFPVSSHQPAAADLAVVRVNSLRATEGTPTPDVEALQLGHAPDYRWLIGKLEYVYVRNAWKLRYASASDADPHGGSVTLSNPGPVAETLRNRLVRVEGQLVEADGSESYPVYQVQSLQLLSLP